MSVTQEAKIYSRFILCTVHVRCVFEYTYNKSSNKRNISLQRDENLIIGFYVNNGYEHKFLSSFNGRQTAVNNFICPTSKEKLATLFTILVLETNLLDIFTYSFNNMPLSRISRLSAAV